MEPPYIEDLRIDHMPGSHWMDRGELEAYCVQTFPVGYGIIAARKLITGYTPALEIRDSSPEKVLLTLYSQRGVQPVYDERLMALRVAYTVFAIWARENIK